MKKNIKKQGFTLIEMLVAATIAALLAAVGLVSYTTANRNARNARRQSDLEQVRAALELYRTEEGNYPSGDFVSVISTLKATGYITAADIKDPRDVAPYVYSFDTDGTYQDCLATKAYEMCARLENGTTNPDWHCVCTP